MFRRCMLFAVLAIAALAMPSAALADPTASPAPDPVDFGGVPVGNTPAPIVVTITNPGLLALNITQLDLLGPASGDYLRNDIDCFSGPIAGGGGTCTFNIVFTPSQVGVRAATLEVVSDDPLSPYVMNVTGFGSGAVFGAAPNPLNLGNNDIALGASGAQTVTVTNTGNTPLTVSAVSVAGVNAADFNIASTDCVTGGPIAALGTCTVDVTFDPSAVGASVASLSFVDDAAGSPHATTLQGNGTTPGFSAVSPLVFGRKVTTKGMTAARRIMVTNTGNAALTISGLAIVGAQRSEFVLAGNTCVGATIPVSGSCRVRVKFDPRKVGDRAAHVRFIHTAGTSPDLVVVRGIGAPPCVPGPKPGCKSNDKVMGTGRDDAMWGGCGRDRMRGKGGDDHMYGGCGNDVINGDGGSDRIRGQKGNDHINGGSGWDVIWGGGGNDVINVAGRWSDTVYCGRGRHDKVIADWWDLVVNCETIIRKGPNPPW